MPVQLRWRSIEEMGLGLLIAAFVLWLLGQITFDMTVNEILGKIIIEAMTVAIGVSIGTAQLGGKGEQEGDTGMKSDTLQSDSSPVPLLMNRNGDFAGQIVIALCGAVLFANVAPTEEIIMIATETASEKLGLALYPCFGCTDTLFIVTLLERSGLVKSAASRLLSSAQLLHMRSRWLLPPQFSGFGRFDGISPITCLKTVVLGLAATLGFLGFTATAMKTWKRIG